MRIFFTERAVKRDSSSSDDLSAYVFPTTFAGGEDFFNGFHPAAFTAFFDTLRFA